MAQSGRRALERELQLMRAEAQRLSRASILAGMEVGGLRARVRELEAEAAGLSRRTNGSDTSDRVHFVISHQDDLTSLTGRQRCSGEESQNFIRGAGG